MVRLLPTLSGRRHDAELLQQAHDIQVMMGLLDLLALEDHPERGRYHHPRAGGGNGATWPFQWASMSPLPDDLLCHDAATSTAWLK